MIKNIISRIPFNIKLTLITFFSFIAIFNIWRLIFFYFYIDDFNSEISLYIKSFYVGYRLDAVLAAILTLPVFLISHFPKITFNRYTRFAYFFYVVLLFIVISFLNTTNHLICPVTKLSLNSGTLMLCAAGHRSCKRVVRIISIRIVVSTVSGCCSQDESDFTSSPMF